MENYDNPVPGAVMLVRARMDDGRLGLLCVDRDLEPKGPALPGGYVDSGECAEEAALRELWEECGIDWRGGEARVVCTKNGANNRLVVFCSTKNILEGEELARVLSAPARPEVKGLMVFGEERLEEMVFKKHREVGAAYLKEALADDCAARVLFGDPSKRLPGGF